MMTPKIKCSSKHSGFTLIEVLITVVILSIGLLGMAGIQIQGLRGTTSSTVRSQATILANDIAERIRMNVDGMAVENNPTNDDYTNVSITRNDQGVPNIDCAAQQVTFCSAAPGVAANECTTAQMATFDIFEFSCGLGRNGGVLNLLPNGTASISCNNGAEDCGPGSELAIRVNWTETNDSPGDERGDERIKTLTMVIIP